MKTVLEIECGDGIFRTKVWRTDEGTYFFDGPACNGPKHVRESGRGPHWRGKVDPAFIRSILRALKNRGIEHKVTYDEGGS